MTQKYDNVYVDNASTIAGPLEKKGPLKDTFDRVFNNYYYGCKSWEKAEAKILNQSIKILLDKANLKKEDIDTIISGDLLNQITASCFGISEYNIPFLGIYSACDTPAEGMIIGSNLVESGSCRNVIVTTSSHNKGAEKQFRNPTEYGAIKTNTATFTATGAASILLTNRKTDIKLTSSTIGRIINYQQTDVLNMGAVMAPAAADTIYRHLQDMNRSINDYDMILTGDLGKYGKELLEILLKEKYNIDIKNIHKDCGLLLYNLEKQKSIKAGGSGPVCGPLVIYGSILEKLRKREIKRILMVSTGALFSATSVFQHEKILGIAHAVCLEVA